MLVCGGLFVVSAQSSEGTDLRPGRYDDLATLVDGEADRYQSLTERVAELTADVTALTAQVAYVTMRSLVHPDVYAAVGLDPQEARRQALGNEAYRETIAWMGEKVMPVLEESGMVGQRDHKVWRASFLMR